MNFKVVLDLPVNVTGYDAVKFVSELPGVGDKKILYVLNNNELWCWNGSSYENITTPLTNFQRDNIIKNCDFEMIGLDRNCVGNVYMNMYHSNFSVVSIHGNNIFQNVNNCVFPEALINNEFKNISNCTFPEFITDNEFNNISDIDFTLWTEAFKYLRSNKYKCWITQNRTDISTQVTILEYYNASGVKITILNEQ